VSLVRTHQTIDTIWHGLHSAAIRQHHLGAINARGSRILVSDAEFRRVLPPEGYRLGPGGEIEEARGAVALVSKRAAQVLTNPEPIEAAWRRAPRKQPSERLRNGWRPHTVLGAAWGAR
jgi:hypothetical protein